MYTIDASSQARLSAQTAMQHILESLVRSIAPILSFTAEEIWGHMTGEREETVLYATRYDALDDMPIDASADAEWDTLIAIRNEVSKQIEALRAKGDVGSALDAHVSLFASGDAHSIASKLGDELRFVLITSGASLHDLSDAPESAVQTELDGLKVMALSLIHI